MVRCKFVCTSKVTKDSGGTDIALSAVVAGSSENAAFFEATPSGHISFFTVNDTAAALFEVDKDYYADFSLDIADVPQEQANAVPHPHPVAYPSAG